MGILGFGTKPEALIGMVVSCQGQTNNKADCAKTVRWSWKG